jgi:hypothetical protein
MSVFLVDFPLLGKAVLAQSFAETPHYTPKIFSEAKL